jgi:hypothetical protein
MRGTCAAAGWLIVALLTLGSVVPVRRQEAPPKPALDIAPLVDAPVSRQLAGIRRLLYAVSGGTLVNLGLLAWLFVQGRKAARAEASGKKARDEQRDERLSKLAAAMASRSIVEELGARLDALQERLEACEERARQAPPPAPRPEPDGIPLEREVFGETWRKFQREHREVLGVLEAALRDDRWRDIREPLLLQLPPCVPDDLKPSFDAAMTSPREFHHLVTKLTVAQRLARNELEPLAAVQELTRLREYINFLVILQHTNLASDRLNFRLESWIMDQFLGFADLFLQRAQQCAADAQRPQPDSLALGQRIIERVLKLADLQPVALVPGVTPFDSSRHVGRSTTSDARLANGVIAGVIRNGFVRGQKVIRQPEVIVNRVG